MTKKRIDSRIEKLESETEARQPKEGSVSLIMKLCCGANPTEEEIEAAKKHFLEEHPNDVGPIVLKFKPRTLGKF